MKLAGELVRTRCSTASYDAAINTHDHADAIRHYVGMVELDSLCLVLDTSQVQTEKESWCWCKILIGSRSVWVQDNTLFPVRNES